MCSWTVEVKLFYSNSLAEEEISKHFFCLNAGLNYFYVALGCEQLQIFFTPHKRLIILKKYNFL